MKPVVLDTNILLDDATVIDNHENIIIPIAVLEELDGLKKGQETGYRARQAIKKIEQNISKIEVVIQDVYNNIPEGWDKDKRDNKIILTALNRNADLISNDINVRIKAQSLGIECIGLKVTCEDLYKGHKELEGDTNFVNCLFDDISNGKNTYGFLQNEYLILNNTDLDNVTEYRFDGKKFVGLKLPTSKVIKGLNSQQRCALDLLNSTDIGIKVLMGTYGSGKTYLATRMALHHATDKGTVGKLIVIREPVGEGNQVGFLKGDFQDKTMEFFRPIQQSLEGGEFQLQALIQRGVLETNIPYYLKGTTYNSSFLLIDEASDLSMKQIKMIGTRVGKDAMIAFVGDYKQAVYNATTNNPLIQMCEKLKGNPSFGCVTLSEDVRSNVSKIFADM